MTKLLTTQEAAAQLRVSVSTLRGWRRQGKGPRVLKFGPSTYRYSEDELKEYVASKIGQEQELAK